MAFNWSTFFLEIINFLVLVWLIKHFFYKPVCNIIDKRRLAIEEQLVSARALQADAENVKEQYESRLSDWEQEKNQQQKALNLALDDEKKKKFALLDKQLREEEQKNFLVQKKQLEMLEEKNQRQALDQGASFTAALLKTLSSEALENQLIEIFLKNLDNLSSEQQEELKNIYAEDKPEVTIVTAYPLSQIHRDKLEQSIQIYFKNTLQCEYHMNQEIIAGLRVNMGSYVLRANLNDELSFFSAAANGR